MSISHRRVAYQYWQRDGEDKLLPVSGIPCPSPLTFYCPPQGEIIVGEDATDALNSRQKGAYDQFFNLLGSDIYYNLGGKQRHINKLLIDASEPLFDNFYHDVMFRPRGAIIHQREQMPLTIVCESDITGPQKAFLLNEFKEAGYRLTRVVNYDDYLGQYIRDNFPSQYDCRYVLVAWTEGGDLILSLFNVQKKEPVAVETLPNMGLDPRVDSVKDLIWQRVTGTNPWLKPNRQQYESILDKAAANFLDSGLQAVNNQKIIIAGFSYNYNLNRNQIALSVQNEKGAALREKVMMFLERNGIPPTRHNEVILLLRGDAAKNDFFSNNMGAGFARIVPSKPQMREKVMRLIINDNNAVADSSPIRQFERPFAENRKTPNPKPAVVEEESLDLGELEVFIYDGPLGDEEEEEELEYIQKDDEVEDDLIIESIELYWSDEEMAEYRREWRNLKLRVDPIKRNNPEEAKRSVSEFIERISVMSGLEDLIDTANAYLTSISHRPAVVNVGRVKQPHFDGEIHPNGKWVWVSAVNGGKGDWRVIGGPSERKNRK